LSLLIKNKIMKNSRKITNYTRENGVKVYTLEINGKPVQSSTDAAKIINLLLKYPITKNIY